VDDVTQTQVVIKRLGPRPPTVAARLQALARVEDDNLVTVYDVVEGPNDTAIIMEYVPDAVSLRHILATQGPTGPLAALSAFSGSLLGLAAAHQARVPHGSYSPERVLVDGSGLARVTGFGTDTLNAAGIVGEPDYLAPEQWSGGSPGPAADLYAATAVFFECLTGNVPYQARKIADLARAHQGAPIPVDAVPGPIKTLIARGLAKDPDERPRSAADFLGELEDAAVEAYGSAWENQGRGHLAEMAQHAATMPEPPVREEGRPKGLRGRRRASGPAQDDAAADAFAGVTGRYRGPEADGPGGDQAAYWEATGFDRASGLGAGSGTGVGAGLGAGLGTAEGGSRSGRAGDLGEPDAAGDPWSGGFGGTGGYGADRGSSGVYGGSDSRTYGGSGRGRNGIDSTERAFMPLGAPVPDTEAPPERPPADREGPSRGERRQARGRSRRQLLLAVGGAVAAVAAIAVGVATLGGGGSSHATPGTQSPPTPNGSTEPNPDTVKADALATSVSKAVGLRQTASFTYHGPGGTGGPTDTISAIGIFKTDTSGPSAYQATVWNPGDKRYGRRLTTVLIGGTGYVASGGHWRSVPVASAASPPTPEGKPDLTRVYTTMAAGTRWASSPESLLAVLRASTAFQQTGPVYTGESALATLAGDPESGSLWSRYDQSLYKLTYSLRLDSDGLPVRMEIRLQPRGATLGSTPLVFLSTYSKWGHKAAISAPTVR
jgi:hypothetical protein